jgi:hypothetical protein
VGGLLLSITTLLVYGMSENCCGGRPWLNTHRTIPTKSVRCMSRRLCSSAFHLPLPLLSEVLHSRQDVIVSNDFRSQPKELEDSFCDRPRIFIKAKRNIDLQIDTRLSRIPQRLRLISDLTMSASKTE